MVLTRRGILSTSVLCIVGVIILPILGNLISNDLYYILQSWLSLRRRLLIVTVMIILCVFAVIMEVLYQKDRRLFVRLFNDIRLLLPLFTVFKGHSYLKVWEPPDSQITQCTRPGFRRAYDPLRNDPDTLIIRNMLDCYREEGSRVYSLLRIHMALKVDTEQKVPDVEAALQSQYTTKSSRILHRRFEIVPETGVDLDVLSLQIAEAMRLARGIDKYCTLQFGSFAFLKYIDGELKWWRLHEHWTPVIYDIRRCPGNIATGERSKWIIRGSNLQEATLKVSTSDEKEEITIVHRRKMENGEDELVFAEPGLIWRSALMFWRGVYICAWNSVSKESEGLTFNLQSESRNVTRAYWISVAEGFISNPRTKIMIIVNLVMLGFLGCAPHGSHSAMRLQFGFRFLGYLKIRVYGHNFDILPKLTNMHPALFVYMVFIFIQLLVVVCWWSTAKLRPPSGCPLPQQEGSPDSQHGRSPDLPVTDDPDLLSLVDGVVGEIDKARDEKRAQEECALSRFSGPADGGIIPSVISRSSERLASAQPSHHDVPLMACTEHPVSDLEAACLHPLKKTDTNIVRKEEEEETTAVADSDHFSVRGTTSDMIEFESNGKREIMGESDYLGDDVPGPTRAITPERCSDISCPSSPLLHEVNANIKENEEEKDYCGIGRLSNSKASAVESWGGINQEISESSPSSVKMLTLQDLFYRPKEDVWVVKPEKKEKLKKGDPKPPPPVPTAPEESFGAYFSFYRPTFTAPAGPQKKSDPTFTAPAVPQQKSDDTKKIEFRVPICCTECVDAVTCDLNKEGVKTVVCDVLRGKVTVTVKNDTNADDVLLVCRRRFRKSRLWPKDDGETTSRTPHGEDEKLNLNVGSTEPGGNLCPPSEPPPPVPTALQEAFGTYFPYYHPTFTAPAGAEFVT